MTEFNHLLRPLVQHEVAFIVVGGVAAIAHGSARLTEDLDVVYQRSSENLKRLVSALAPYKPYLRGAPPQRLVISTYSVKSRVEARTRTCCPKQWNWTSLDFVAAA